MVANSGEVKYCDNCAGEIDLNVTVCPHCGHDHTAFKKCKNGHIFESKLNECSYCGGAEMDEELKKLSPNERMMKLPIPPCCYAPKAWDDDGPRRKK